jgi:hypothetical protein
MGAAVVVEEAEELSLIHPNKSPRVAGLLILEGLMSRDLRQA